MPGDAGIGDLGVTELRDGLTCLQIKDLHVREAGDGQLLFARVHRQLKWRETESQALGRLARSQVVAAEGPVHVSDDQLLAVRKEAEGVENAARFFQHQARLGSGKLPDLQPAEGVAPLVPPLPYRQEPAVVAEVARGLSGAHARQPVDFVIVGHAANADVARAVQAGVALQRAVEFQPGAAGGPAVPFLGDAHVELGQAGDGLVAQLQEIRLRQVQVLGQPGRLGQDREGLEALAEAVAQPAGLRLGH